MSDKERKTGNIAMEEEKVEKTEENTNDEVKNQTIEGEVTSEEEVAVDEVANLKKTIEDLQNRLLRSQADFDNYRKRTRTEKEELAKYANAKLIEALLPTFDNFARAIEASKENQNFETLVQGVEMVYRQLEELLVKEGLEPIEAVGQHFDPEIHQAVMQVESDQYESGVVVEELQKGYKFKGKVIRPSMVKVNT
ncbi:nucleotide exchange factor GrpE [Vulcanibacillus modesticaldus]|uniref:Protein GrpE n=1 Tax=Vulcanibacillus modesticaldus TaxID=337097 RepID=A0A1D2YSA6_9BACI|nr:nucleotide exchange factor GrpE [Vulcanibacillus modesticaldus]OEF96939.1 nucleotide exchange factor GrpE [Vulcanibacillus modesticaldus]